MQTQDNKHIGRERFGKMYACEIQYMKHHREGKGPLDGQEREWLANDKTWRYGDLSAFFAFAAASVLVLLGCLGGRSQRRSRRLWLLGGWGWGGLSVTQEDLGTE
jgi:hypothetical protein